MRKTSFANDISLNNKHRFSTWQLRLTDMEFSMIIICVRAMHKKASIILSCILFFSIFFFLFTFSCIFFKHKIQTFDAGNLACTLLNKAQKFNILFGDKANVTFTHDSPILMHAFHFIWIKWIFLLKWKFFCRFCGFFRHLFEFDWPNWIQ